MLTPNMLIYSAVRLTDQMYINMASKKSMNLKFINIVDPTFSKNNLGKSISQLNSSRIRFGMGMQFKRVNDLYLKASRAETLNRKGGEVLLNGLLKMF